VSAAPAEDVAGEDARVPFTPCHAAAALPFVRTPLVPSAVVVGSMAPDAFYYVLVRVPVQTHALWSAVTVDVVIGAVLLAFWHLVLRRPVVAATPASLRERLPVPAAVPATAGARARRGGLVLLSLAVGSLTHVLWDAFTHRGRWGVELVPWLGEVHGPLEGYRWAQYGSGVVGALILGWWLARWYRRTPPRAAAQATRGHVLSELAPGVAVLGWAAVLGAAAVVGVLSGSEPLLGAGPPDPRGAAYVAATRGGAAAAVVATVLALVVAWSWRREPARA
jgi:hypothetical protein